MSPEYTYEELFSVKSDVFSFGVVILEILSGRRNSKIFECVHGVSLLGHVSASLFHLIIKWLQFRSKDTVDNAS